MGKFLIDIVSFLIPVAVLLATVAIMLVPKMLWQRRIAKRNRRSPLVRKMLRSPGDSLRVKLEDLTTETDFLIVMAFMMPFVIYSVLVTQIYLSDSGSFAIEIFSGCVIAIIGILTILRIIFSKFEIMRTIRLGLEGELATAEELNKLMLDGFHVFHDLPFEYGNIDHIVVGESGVFAIETKARGKGDTTASHKVTVDRSQNGIKFADYNWKLNVNQLEANQRWLSNTLSKATALDVVVESMLALPGYFIEKRVGHGGFTVFNPRNCQPHFADGTKRFSKSQVKQISHQVEQLCRDIEPSFKGDLQLGK